MATDTSPPEESTGPAPGPKSSGVQPRRAIRILGSLALAALSVCVALLIAEAGFALLLAHPTALRHLPRNVASHVRAYYMSFDRDLVQTMPECTQWDKELFYILQPGSCRFKAREFDVRLDINSLGVRDSEGALRAPEVVVLGDSYAMGWGVAQDETFAASIRRQTGLRTLDAGVPSYGTAREMLLLNRVDSSQLRYLVIQYSANDNGENLTFQAEHHHLDIGSRKLFARDVINVRKRQRYYLGSITWRIVRGIFRPEPSTDLVLPPQEAAQLFIHAVMHGSRADLERVQIIAFEASPFEVMNGAFAEALARECVRDKYPAFIRRMRVIDFHGRLRREHYFDLDDHLRASGHAIVGQAIAEIIRSQEAVRAR